MPGEHEQIKHARFPQLNALIPVPALVSSAWIQLSGLIPFVSNLNFHSPLAQLLEELRALMKEQKMEVQMVQQRAEWKLLEMDLLMG